MKMESTHQLELQPAWGLCYHQQKSPASSRPPSELGAPLSPLHKTLTIWPGSTAPSPARCAACWGAMHPPSPGRRFQRAAGGRIAVLDVSSQNPSTQGKL